MALKTGRERADVPRLRANLHEHLATGQRGGRREAVVHLRLCQPRVESET